MGIPKIENFADLLLNSAKVEIRGSKYVPKGIKNSRRNWTISWVYDDIQFKLWVASKGCDDLDDDQGAGEQKPIGRIVLAACANFTIDIPQINVDYLVPKITDIANPKCDVQTTITKMMADYDLLAAKLSECKAVSNAAIRKIKDTNKKQVSKLADDMDATTSRGARRSAFGQHIIEISPKKKA